MKKLSELVARQEIIARIERIKSKADIIKQLLSGDSSAGVALRVVATVGEVQKHQEILSALCGGEEPTRALEELNKKLHA